MPKPIAAMAAQILQMEKVAAPNAFAADGSLMPLLAEVHESTPQPKAPDTVGKDGLWKLPGGDAQ